MIHAHEEARSLESRFAEVEIGCYRELALALDSAERTRLGVGFEDLGEAGALLVCRAFPHLLFNRSLGLGALGPATPTALAATLSTLGAPERAPNFQINVSPHAEPEDLTDTLRKRGLVPFRRDLLVLEQRGDVSEASTRFRIREASSEHVEAVSRILGAAFDVPEPLRPAFGGLLDRPGCSVFVALEGEAPIAAGVLYLREQTGYLAFAATAPSHRGGGAHDALIARRIQAARHAGCDTLFVDTGTPVPDEPSPSLENLRRAGFEPRFVRKSFVPPHTSWTGALEPPCRPTLSSRLRP